MDDIYRNYLSGGGADTPAGEEQQQQHPRHRTPSASDKMEQPEQEDVGFDEGFVTGYAIPTSAGGRYRPASPSWPRARPSATSGHHHWELLEGETERGYARGDTLHTYPLQHHWPPYEPQESRLTKAAPGGGSVGLKDLFDIALTTLAFLSFGMFILQVIMCITMTKGETGMMVLPTQPIEVEVDGGEVRRDRYSRQLPVATAPVAVRELNQLAGHALNSIEVMLDGAGGGGPTDRRRLACIQRTLCRANRFSRTLTTIGGYWVSVWR